VKVLYRAERAIGDQAARFGGRGGGVRVGFDKRWLVPFGVLVTSALVVLSVFAFGSSFVVADCSGALSSDYACYQERYQSLVRVFGVETAFDELKGEYGKNGFVRSNCHQLTHVIGRAAVERYGDIPTTYGRGEGFCGSGYYHGVMQAVVARIGAERILEEADALCSEELGERQKYSLYHRDCAHGLGHGFMGVLNNELFDSLHACDVLTDGWEREHCYTGVFRENVQAKDDPNHPSKYLKADQPLYPCTEVEDRYKNSCYRRQPMYALWTQDNDFAKVFDLCATVEDDFRPACHHGLGRSAFFQSIEQQVTDVAQAESTRILCMRGEEQEAQSNCIAGAVKTFIYYNRGDTARGEAFCGPFEAGLRAVCGRAAEEFYEDFALD
jgi:hypothetical protein